MQVIQLKTLSTPYTYILEWTQHNKRYIGARWAKGCHPDDLWKEYFTSSKYVEEFVRENGDPDIILIDKIFITAQDARLREIELLKQYDIKNNPVFLNKAIGGIYEFNDPEIKIKQKQSRLGLKHSPGHIIWLTEFHRTRVRSKETNKRISESLTGKKLSPEHAEKCRLVNLGRIHTDETRDKMRESHSKRSKEDRRLSRLGKPHSIETKLEMSRIRTGKTFWDVTCPHCEKTGGVTGMKRWHFDNCKLLKRGD